MNALAKTNNIPNLINKFTYWPVWIEHNDILSYPE